MKKMHMRSVKPGDILSRPIWTANGSFLLGVGMKLNERYIEKLLRLGTEYVYVDDQLTSDIIPEDSIQDETRKMAVQTVYKTMAELKAAPLIQRRVSLPNLGKEYRQIIGDILLDLTRNKALMFNLTSINVKDEYLFQHAVNVAVLAGIVGIAKGYNRTQLTELGIGALLYDIGMTGLPDEFWQNPSRLTPEQMILMQKHTEEGFEILRKQPDIPLLSAHCALQHHERFDGSGYPRGLKGKEIHEYAQIVAIADVYNALTSPRTYRKAYSASEAVEFLFASGNQWFDIDLIKVFCNHIAIYPVAATVLLNTGQVGVVSAVNQESSHRPFIRIVQEPDGNPPGTAYELNLSKQLNVTILKEL
ncbi:HD-GYP domain-containing protein [Cohnella pontilimi]|uniref:HD-GYP domain-containing protein n=1 Tax=Cohnella pontilimi TaxID=2564100 RepID=A0A4U0FI32_9BACL|nr:HD-GYP domain-containing protein [Cohnella pontilimi]TJY43102.1 HD-GYP domain-containing protein [Cohnella pontilimi]